MGQSFSLRDKRTKKQNASVYKTRLIIAIITSLRASEKSSDPSCGPVCQQCDILHGCVPRPCGPTAALLQRPLLNQRDRCERPRGAFLTWTEVELVEESGSSFPRLNSAVSAPCRSAIASIVEALVCAHQVV